MSKEPSIASRAADRRERPFEARRHGLERRRALLVAGDLGEIGVGERGEHIPVRGKQSPQPPDALTDRDQVLQQSASPLVAQSDGVELVGVALDDVGGRGNRS